MTTRDSSVNATPFIQRLVLVLAALLALVTGAIAEFVEPSLRELQLFSGLALLTGAALLLDKSASQIPTILRPATVLFGSLVLGSIDTSGVTNQQFPAYVALWSCEVAGFLLGILLLPSLNATRRLGHLAIDPVWLAKYSRICWFVFVLAALAFFAAQGIPALLPNVEQSRVTAAVSGTGYFRLLGYMTGPAALILFAVRGKAAWPYLAVAVLIIAGLADRSPLLYLIAPIITVIVISSRRRISSLRLIVISLLLLAVVAAIGTYRIVSQKDFKTYSEYRQNIASHNYLGVALTSVEHYASVIPENAVLTKRLVDEGKIHYQLGQTYATLFLSALPWKQGKYLSPDLLIKQVSEKSFVGGGTPPTLAGEGYINGGLPGVVLSAFGLMLLLRYWAAALLRAVRSLSSSEVRVTALIYGYVVAWGINAQVAGLAGASTVPLAGFLFLVVLRWISATRRPA